VILVDTSVLVYAVGDDHRLQTPSRRLVELVAEGTIRASTTVEAVQEFVHVRGRRRSRRDAATYGRAYATLFAPLVEPTPVDLVRGLSLFEQHERVGAFDAVLAATAERVSGGVLVSGGRGFPGVDGLRVLDPADDGFEELLLEFGR
jgi:uncharacterized protein